MKKQDFTLVTGLWDMGRKDLKDFSRSFEHYLETFDKLLSLDFNFLVYIPKELNLFVNKRRDAFNTRIINRELEDFDTWFEHFDRVQSIRTKPEWYEQTGKGGWLENSPQAKLKYYNPVVMSKFFMVNDATYHNPFNTKYFFWIDAGLVNTVSVEHLSNMNRLETYMKDIGDDFLFLSYPYETQSEVHGFNAEKFNEYCGEKSQYVCRGGFFGGSKAKINDLNSEYYNQLSSSLNENLMGTEECIHTILAYRYHKKVHRFELEGNGLVYKFFDHLGTLDQSNKTNTSLIKYNKKKNITYIKTSMYVLTYNSPDQFKHLIETYRKNDSDFFNIPRKILIDNSTDRRTFDRYNILCKKYGFEHIKKEDNIGICGGRMFAAEHFHESDSEYYIFLEDDMNLHSKTDDKCPSGYNKYVENLYQKSLAIVHKERYDYLKLTFSEFYGNNQTQWAWYNVPQDVREKYFPDYSKLPEEGLDPNAPKIIPNVKKRYKGLSYFEGDYYYCNWPIWFSREGNYKVFLETKWAHPFEQTWMSYVFQQQKAGRIRSAILALSPIDHVRFDFYPAEERVES
jgi:hypothetical protein